MNDILDNKMLLKLDKYVKKINLNSNNNIYMKKYQQYSKNIQNTIQNTNCKIQLGGCSTVDEKLTKLITQITEINKILYEKIKSLSDVSQSHYIDFCYIKDATAMILQKVLLLFNSYTIKYCKLYSLLQTNNVNFDFSKIKQFITDIEQIIVDEKDNDCLEKILEQKGGTIEENIIQINDELQKKDKLFEKVMNMQENVDLNNCFKCIIENFKLATDVFLNSLKNMNKILETLITKIENGITDSKITVEHQGGMRDGELQPNGTIKIENQILTPFNIFSF